MGVGRTQPDEASMLVLPDGLQVPLGKPVTNLEVNTPLHYNEYPLTVNIDIKLRFTRCPTNHSDYLGKFYV